jgi:uncharacterized protein DUF4349
MSNVPEELDPEITALIEKLGPAPQRDPQIAAVGKAKFLAEANYYRASVSAASRQRHMERKENPMWRLQIPALVPLTVVIGLVIIVALQLTGPIVGNTFSTINKSLNSVGGPPRVPGAATVSGPQGAAPGLHLGQTPASPGVTASAGAALPQGSGYRNQMVVKNADIRLLVEDTDRALDGVTQAVTDAQGYVISSRTWYQGYNGKNYKYATLTIGVPVDQFENAMRRLRSLAVQVLDENASGEDVTNQYVDLQSQVTNLEATRDRIKSFLDQAKTVDDVLRIDLELSRVEAQIEQLKGQMNYLSNRSAFSTITINLEPALPAIRPTPVPTATPIPPQGLGPWDPGKTTEQATVVLVSTYRLIVEFLIWVFVAVVPIVGPPALLIWLAVWLISRRNRTATKGQGA